MSVDAERTQSLIIRLHNQEPFSFPLGNMTSG